MFVFLIFRFVGFNFQFVFISLFLFLSEFGDKKKKWMKKKWIKYKRKYSEKEIKEGLWKVGSKSMHARHACKRANKLWSFCFSLAGSLIMHDSPSSRAQLFVQAMHTFSTAKSHQDKPHERLSMAQSPAPSCRNLSWEMVQGVQTRRLAKGIDSKQVSILITDLVGSMAASAPVFYYCFCVRHLGSSRQ